MKPFQRWDRTSRSCLQSLCCDPTSRSSWQSLCFDSVLLFGHRLEQHPRDATWYYIVRRLFSRWSKRYNCATKTPRYWGWRWDVPKVVWPWLTLDFAIPPSLIHVIKASKHTTSMLLPSEQVEKSCKSCRSTLLFPSLSTLVADRMLKPNSCYHYYHPSFLT